MFSLLVFLLVCFSQGRMTLLQYQCCPNLSFVFFCLFHTSVIYQDFIRATHRANVTGLKCDSACNLKIITLISSSLFLFLLFINIHRLETLSLDLNTRGIAQMCLSQ